MDLGPLRALALDLTSSAHGVVATVTRPAPDQAPIITRGVWITTPLEEPRAFGTDFARREPRRVFALSKATVPTLPRGTVMVAADRVGGSLKVWRVDGLDPQVVPEQWRAIVTEVVQ
jgi:hypothetical protein